MIPNQTRRERGQTLVVVALMMGVLMLMAGLAVDVGMAYNERRDLQNAADAAALAGAQQLCDNRGATAANAAAVAIGQANGAVTVTPEITATQTVRRMRVTVQAPSPTFFFRLAGIGSVPVSARATAECSCAAAVAGAWPIAFDRVQWDAMGCMLPNGDYDLVGPNNEKLLPPHMMVWEDNNKNVFVNDLCAICNCTIPFGPMGISQVSAWGGNPMAPGNRGWVELASPPHVTQPPWGDQNCTGADTLRTWLMYGYPGLISDGVCVATHPGEVNKALKDAHDGGIRDASIVLFQPNPNPACTQQEVIGDCKSAPLLRVAGTGCIRVRRIYFTRGNDRSATLSLNAIGTTSACQIPALNRQGRPTTVSVNNDNGILATKMCGTECRVTGGGQPGGIPDANCVKAVGLVE